VIPKYMETCADLGESRGTTLGADKRRKIKVQTSTKEGAELVLMAGCYEVIINKLLPKRKAPAQIRSPMENSVVLRSPLDLYSFKSATFTSPSQFSTSNFVRIIRSGCCLRKFSISNLSNE
jgi:hypothetical protein